MRTSVLILAVCLVAVASALTEGQKSKLKEHRNGCIAETGVEATKVNNAKKGEYDDTDEKLACFSGCMLKKIGILNEDNTFNEEVTRSKIPANVPADKAEDVISKCKSVTGTNACDVGRNLYKCYIQNKSFSILE